MSTNDAPLTGAAPRRPYAALLTALSTVLAWNVLLLAGWMAWVVISTRQDPDWGDLVAIVGAMAGLVGFLVSASIGALVVAVMNRRGRWRDRRPAPVRAAGYGVVAAAVGLVPLAMFALYALVSSALGW